MVLQFIFRSIWSGWQDSNLRHLHSKCSTLPTELHPDHFVVGGGAATRLRTPDILITSEALYQTEL